MCEENTKRIFGRFICDLYCVCRACDRLCRRPDCVTEIRMGNSVLTVSGFFKQGATDTAADKMMKVLEAEAATQKTAI